MSDNGYGTDIGYTINPDGTIDIDVGDSGDITIIGGSGDDNISVKRKNAIQNIILRLLTPYGSLVDQNSNSVPYGSNLQGLIGSKDTEINRMAIRAYVMAAIQDYNAIEAVVGIDVNTTVSGTIGIKLSIKLKNDDEIINEYITLGET